MFARERFVQILLWYNVLSLAIWLGGTIYQMLVIVPIWSASPPESVHSFFTGTTYTRTIYNFFGPVTQIARALPLAVLAVVAWNFNVRPWILVCAGTMVFGLVLTRAWIYGINDVLIFKASDLPADAVRALVSKWIVLDRIRAAVMAGGYLCLLRAFSLPLVAT